MITLERFEFDHYDYLRFWIQSYKYYEKDFFLKRLK